MAKKKSIDVNAVIAAYRETGSAPATGKRFGLGSSSVYRILDQNGVSRERGIEEWRTRSRAFTPEQQEQVVAEYVAGASYATLAKRHAVSLVTVRKAVLRAGQAPRHRGRDVRSFARGEAGSVVSLYDAGFSQELIAAEVGTSQSLVSRVLRENGRVSDRSHERHASWNGGTFLTGSGYVMQWVASDDALASMRHRNGYVLEHRLVMARALGRPLTAAETVHHINGDRTDNRIENLRVLCPNCHSVTETWCQSKSRPA